MLLAYKPLWQRWIRLSLAMLFLVAGLGDFLSEATVRHELCAEHGRFGHVEGHGHHAVPEEEPSEEHEHEHCGFWADHRSDGVEIDDPSTWIAAQVYTTERPLQPSSLVTRDDSSRYRVAPKTSPPAHS